MDRFSNSPFAIGVVVLFGRETAKCPTQCFRVILIALDGAPVASVHRSAGDVDLCHVILTLPYRSAESGGNPTVKNEEAVGLRVVGLVNEVVGIDLVRAGPSEVPTSLSAA